MKFLSVNNFVNATIKIEDKAVQINVVFSTKDAVEDKFGKINAIPLLIVITNDDNNKVVWDYDSTLEKYEDDIKISLPKCDKSKNGYANMQISTIATYSEKFQTYFYKKQYGDLTNKVIAKAKDSQEQKRKHDQADVLDI